MTSNQFQLTVDGQTTVIGQNVQQHAGREHELELGLVQTLLPKTVELTVPDVLKKLRPATLTLAQVRIETTNLS